MDKGYQSVALTVKSKTDKKVYKTLSKVKTMILLMDQTRIVVPQSLRKKLMDREHLAH